MKQGAGTQLLLLTRVLAIGPVFAQLLLLAASPVLTRIFLPSAFAEIAAFLLAGGALASLACLKLDNAIIKERSTGNAARAAMVALASVVVFSISAGMVTLLVAVALDNPKLKWYGVLLAAYLFVGGVYDILNALALRKQLARVVTRGRIILAVASLVAQITLGVYLGDARFFVFGLVLGYLVATADLARALRIRLLPGLSRSMVRDVLSRNASDTTHGSFSALLFTVGNNIPAVILTLTAGPTIGGYFALLQRVAFNPVLILTTLLTQSMLPWLAKHRTSAARQVMLLTASKLAWFFLGISLLMLPLAETFFAFAFGEVWRKAGTFAAVLLVVLPCRVAFEVLANLLVVENRQAPLFLIRAFNLAIGLLVLLVFSMQHPEISVFVYALLQTMVALIGILVINKVTGLNALRFLRNLSFVVGFAHVLVALYMNPYRGSFGAMWLALLSLALGAALMGWSVFGFRTLLRSLKDDAQPTN